MTNKLFIFAMLLLSFACGSEVKESNTTKQTVATLGNNKDINGCKASMGETWSRIMTGCIRLQEDAIRLDPAYQTSDKTVAAYIIFGESKTEVELFMPSTANTEILKKIPGESTWYFNDLILRAVDNQYQLSLENRVFYQTKA